MNIKSNRGNRGEDTHIYISLIPFSHSYRSNPLLFSAQDLNPGSQESQSPIVMGISEAGGIALIIVGAVVGLIVIFWIIHRLNQLGKQGSRTVTPAVSDRPVKRGPRRGGTGFIQGGRGGGNIGQGSKTSKQSDTTPEQRRELPRQNDQALEQGDNILRQDFAATGQGGGKLPQDVINRSHRGDEMKDGQNPRPPTIGTKHTPNDSQDRPTKKRQAQPSAIDETPPSTSLPLVPIRNKTLPSNTDVRSNRRNHDPDPHMPGSFSGSTLSRPSSGSNGRAPHDHGRSRSHQDAEEAIGDQDRPDESWATYVVRIVWHVIGG